MVSGQWFSGWAACVPMQAAPANPSDPKNILLNWGKSPSGPTGTSLSSLPARLLSPLRLVPSLLCCSRLFLPFILLFDFPSLSSVSRVVRGSAGLCSPRGDPQRHRLLSPVRAPLWLLAHSRMKEFLPCSVTRLVKVPPGNGAERGPKPFLSEVIRKSEVVRVLGLITVKLF